jgi:hypothetical protein
MLNSLGELCITIPKNQSCSESDPTVPHDSTSSFFLPSWKSLVHGARPYILRPRKLDENDIKKIEDNARVLTEDLLDGISNKVNTTSICRLMHEQGRLKWLVLDRPDLSPEHAATRLHWALEY